MKRGNFPIVTDKCESHRNVTVQVSVRVLRDSDGFSDDSRTDRLPGMSGVGDKFKPPAAKPERTKSDL